MVSLSRSSEELEQTQSGPSMRSRSSWTPGTALTSAASRRSSSSFCSLRKPGASGRPISDSMISTMSTLVRPANRRMTSAGVMVEADLGEMFGVDHRRDRLRVDEDPVAIEHEQHF